MKPHVYVGMSGGVDSSLAAALLVEQGYKVTGVYMKNWTRDLPGVRCPWADDLADAKRVAVHLGIDFKVFDFENEYRERVVDYMLDEYRSGHTPNPDIMCNQEVKFKLFLDLALKDGADMIATGHYARVRRFGCCATNETSIQPERLRTNFVGCRCSSKIGVSLAESAQSEEQLSEKVVAVGEPNAIDEQSSSMKVYFDDSCTEESLPAKGLLLRAVDDNKDQTYFLYRVTGEALGRTLFPIGEFTKPKVREMAAERGLVTAKKKDSQGICFVGQVGIKDFLSEYIEQSPGKIIDQKTGNTLGYHDGAIFYTIGQRHGLELGGGLPYYVAGKDMAKNEVYVTTNLNDENLWQKKLHLTNLHWINEAPDCEKFYDARVRHRAPLVKIKLHILDDGAELEFVETQKAIAPGQSIVLYDDQICLGGGIVV